MTIVRGAGLVVMLALPAAAETQVVTTRYMCERGIEVPATYVTAEDQAVVIIQVEGRQITLFKEPAAAGARYGWPSDGANYVWWSMGKVATLFWKEAEIDSPLLTCEAAS